jgi:hypothetical protein
MRVHEISWGSDGLDASWVYSVPFDGWEQRYARSLLLQPISRTGRFRAFRSAVPRLVASVTVTSELPGTHVFGYLTSWVAWPGLASQSYEVDLQFGELFSKVWQRSFTSVRRDNDASESGVLRRERIGDVPGLGTITGSHTLRCGYSIDCFGSRSRLVGHTFMVCIHIENQNQGDFYPFVLPATAKLFQW